MSLTDTAIKAFKPNEKPYSRADRDGLMLEILPSGSKIWRYRYRLNNRREKVTIGKYPIISLKGARDIHMDMMRRVASGESPAAQKRKTKEGIGPDTPLCEFGEKYYTDIVMRDWGKPGQAAVRGHLEKIIYPTIGSIPMKDIQYEDVWSLVEAKRDLGHPHAALQLRGLLKRIFDYGIVKGVIRYNPASAIQAKYITTKSERSRFLEAREVGDFLRALYADSCPRQHKLALHLIFITLVRKQELGAAKWQDIDLERGQWTITAEVSKTSVPLIIYLPAQAVQMFRELEYLAAGSDYVLPGLNPKRPATHNALNRTLTRVIDSHGLEHFVIHDLRRTGATHLNEAGFSGDHVERALNHTTKGVAGVYNRAQYKDQRTEMLQSWADTLDALRSGADVVPIGSAK